MIQEARGKKHQAQIETPTAEPTPMAAPEPPSTNPPEPPYKEEKQKKEKGPDTEIPPTETWTQNELEEMPWLELKAMAKKYNECEGLTKKAEIISALIGIAKL
jgi:hypothetical protein